MLKTQYFEKALRTGKLRYGGEIGFFNFLQVDKKRSDDRYITFLGDLNDISWKKIL